MFQYCTFDEYTCIGFDLHAFYSFALLLVRLLCITIRQQDYSHASSRRYAIERKQFDFPVDLVKLDIPCCSFHSYDHTCLSQKRTFKKLQKMATFRLKESNI